jgi:hypothetical protein
MQWFVDGLDWNASRTGASVELILVEWNPPHDRPSLSDVLRWPSATSSLSVRLLTVPASEHKRLLPEGGIPMMQMIAKNVGIRRALGDNVLATNVDILLAPELFDIATAAVTKGTLWRADRNDVEFPFSNSVTTVEHALEFSRSHPIRYERKDGIYYPGLGRSLPIYQGLGDFARWQLSHLPATLARLSHGSHDTRSVAPSTVRHRPTNSRSPRSLAQFAVDRGRALIDLVALPKLNVNACGDFTLLTREDWCRFRGYPELVVHSMHLDTIFIHQMHSNGMRFADAEPPAVAFHMEHSLGSGWTPEGHETHFAEVERRGMPHITPAELRAIKRSLNRVRKRETVLYNGPDWGLETSPVAEVRVTKE